MLESYPNSFLRTNCKVELTYCASQGDSLHKPDMKTFKHLDASTT